MAAKARTVLLCLAAFCLPALANVPRASLLSEKPHQGVAGFALASHRGAAADNPLIAMGIAGYLGDEGRRSRSTGKERDAETGLDYFGARYMSAAQGRFTSPDIPLIDQHVHDPQSWNLYAYGRNNPLKNVDPTGNVVETIWDIANVGLDLYSLGSNLYQGNFGSAAVDAGGLILDAAATVVPFVPGGAGTAIKAARAADTVVDAARGLNKADSVADAAKAADNATDLSKVGRSGKQEKLREVAGDQKAASSDRGWIKQEQNSIDRGQRTTIRNPPGKDLAHERGREAAKGYSYKHSKLQNRADHQRQHRYDDYGRKNKERPLKQGEQ